MKIQIAAASAALVATIVFAVFFASPLRQCGPDDHSGIRIGYSFRVSGC
jgi:hypothetical protein